MIKLIVFLNILTSFAFAGLPPTTSKLNGDANNVTTFNFQFPNMTGTHSGVTTTFDLLNMTGGGTGAALSPVLGGAVYSTGTTLAITAAGTSGQVLTSNGAAAPTWQAVPSTTLQNSYLASSQPQITLNSTQLGLQVRDASTPIGSLLFGVQNNAGSTNYLAVDVNGVSTTNFVGTGTSGAVKLHNLTTAQKNALTASSGMMVYDTDLAKFQCYYGSWIDCVKPNVTSQGVTAGGTITWEAGSYRQHLRLTAVSAITLSTTPFGTSAPLDGAEFTLVGSSDTNTISITSSDIAKGVLDYDVTLGKGDSVTLVYVAIDDRYYFKATGH